MFIRKWLFAQSHRYVLWNESLDLEQKPLFGMDTIQYWWFRKKAKLTMRFTACLCFTAFRNHSTYDKCILDYEICTSWSWLFNKTVEFCFYTKFLILMTQKSKLITLFLIVCFVNYFIWISAILAERQNSAKKGWDGKKWQDRSIPTGESINKPPEDDQKCV